MPPKLNIANAAKYATVEPDFIELMKEIWKARWKVLNDDIKLAPPSYRKIKIENNAPIMSRLRGLCTKPELLDKEITRLRGLAYERFYTREFRGLRYLVGLTRPIEMTDDVRRYQAPRYFVYFPESMVQKGTEAPFHFVPEGHELTLYRHPHHNVKQYYYPDSGGGTEHYDYSDVKDTLEYNPATCWGSFGTIATSCTAAGDVVDLYRSIAIYLTRINQNSLLSRPFSACDFLRDIGPAEAPPPPTITEKTKFNQPTNGRAHR
jgi:hypothetical protein